MSLIDKALIFILIVFLLSDFSQAQSIRVGSYNSSTISQGSVEGSISLPKNPKEDDLYYDFDISGSQSKSKTTDSISSDSSIGGGLTTSSNWSFYLNLSNSKNPSENLNTGESSLSISKKLFYQKIWNVDKKSSGTEDKNEKNRFEPFVKIGLKGSRSFTSQTTATLRTTRTFGLIQSSSNLNLTWQPASSWDFGFSGTKYNYDRDVRGLYNTLGNYPYLSELNSRARNLSDEITTLPESSASLFVSYYLNDSFDFSLNTQRTRDFVSDQFGTTHTLTANYYFLSSWNARLALSSSTRSDDNQKSTASEFSVGYIF